MVSSRGILVKTESTSSLSRKSLLSWGTISSAKVKETFTVNSLDVVEESLETKNFASLQLGVPIAGSISLNGGQASEMAFCTLQSLYKIPGLLQIILIFLYRLVNKLADFSSLFK